MDSFLFESARAYYADERWAGDPGVEGGAVAEGDFLERVVRPLYRCVAQWRQSSSEFPLNYDDANEAFWRFAALARLRTHDDGALCSLDTELCACCMHMHMRAAHERRTAAPLAATAAGRLATLLPPLPEDAP
eukprot:scaffold9657_cov63-Phaeocystis_antarctica.AAC.2